MSKTAMATKCAAMILAVGLSLPTVSGTASAEGELGQGGEWADPAYSTSPDNDWTSESDLVALMTVVTKAWANQQTDLTRLRASMAEREALMAEVDAEKQLAATRGAAELEIQAAQVQAAMALAGGALSLGAPATSRPKGAAPGSSPKGGTTDSSTAKSPGG